VEGECPHEPLAPARPVSRRLPEGGLLARKPQPPFLVRHLGHRRNGDITRRGSLRRNGDKPQSHRVGRALSPQSAAVDTTLASRGAGERDHLDLGSWNFGTCRQRRPVGRFRRKRRSQTPSSVAWPLNPATFNFPPSRYSVATEKLFSDPVRATSDPVRATSDPVRVSDEPVGV
jgi:hypothetical protein